MKKLFTLLCMFAICSMAAIAQRNITGTIVDKETNENVMQATVALLKKDSTFVKGVISDIEGRFSISAP